MIPVKPQPEPASFHAKVRQKGKRWLTSHRLPQAGGIAPSGPELEPYWRDCLDELHAAYGGICAYVCVYIPYVVGGRSVDHFVPKSQDLAGAYEWGNYRLACSHVNGCKGDATDVLDPFDLAPDTFRIELVSGRIYVNPALQGASLHEATTTIERLKLDSPLCRSLRTEHLDEYLDGKFPEQAMRHKSPFLWQELKRQGVL